MFDRSLKESENGQCMMTLNCSVCFMWSDTMMWLKPLQIDTCDMHDHPQNSSHPQITNEIHGFDPESAVLWISAILAELKMKWNSMSCMNNARSAPMQLNMTDARDPTGGMPPRWNMGLPLSLLCFDTRAPITWWRIGPKLFDWIFTHFQIPFQIPFWIGLKITIFICKHSERSAAFSTALSSAMQDKICVSKIWSLLTTTLLRMTTEKLILDWWQWNCKMDDMWSLEPFMKAFQLEAFPAAFNATIVGQRHQFSEPSSFTVIWLVELPNSAEHHDLGWLHGHFFEQVKVAGY